MAHLAPRAGFFFAVEVQVDFGELEHGGPVGSGLPDVSEEVGHGGWRMESGAAEREATDGAELLFELACCASVDGEVA